MMSNRKQPILRLESVAGKMCAVLHEGGKMDYIQPIPQKLQPFFNALIGFLGRREKVKK
ncbi:hypothetical protein LCGC14_2852250 [marine sediment metagenome]|uniref:Uncharacterized protein n=1 Tax=marine sediment metagenome TaxID=412755 RepID=A0A0F9AGD6_9ZZZZ